MPPRIVLITGASSGIGLATARALAAQGDQIIMACRDPRRGAAAQAMVAGQSTGPEPTLVLADLSSQDDVYRLALEVHAQIDHIDVLVNNAGACFARRGLTVDGLEQTFATNYLAAFLLTNLTLDLLERAPAARVVNLASERYARRLDFDNLSGEKSYSLRSAYERSKLEVVIFSNELARRLGGTAVSANSVGPGPSRTRLGDDLRGAVGPARNVVKSLRRFQQADQAAGTVVELASSPNLRGVSGRFFVRRHEQRTRPITHDTRIAGRLWDASELLTMRLLEPKPPPPAPKDHR